MFAKKLDHDLQRFGTIVRPVGDSSVDKQPLLAHRPKRYTRLVDPVRNGSLNEADASSKRQRGPRALKACLSHG
jgi:hypothetical protein